MDFIDLPNFGLLCASLLCYLIGLIVYRLYFHPLAKFPGPKLAALTFWYEYYYDVHQKGRFTWQIKALHEQYGPVIRINPYELHIDDPDFYEEIYTNNARRRDKHLWWAHVDGEGKDMFQTMNHDLHRSRKGPVSPFFSKRSVMALEPLIWEKTTKLVHRFMKAMEGSEVLDLSAAYAALTVDVISQYSFGECNDSLEKDDFGRWWLDFLHSGVQMHPLFRQFPWIVHWLMKLPEAIFVRMNPYGRALLEHDRMWQMRVRRVIEEKAKNKAPAQRTVVHNLLDSSLPPEEKAVNRLAAESGILLGAGTETTARALAYISFVLTDNPEMLAELRTELKTVMPRPQSEVQLTQLEHLPYLTGIVQEGLRLSFGVVGRLPRVIRGETLQYKEWTIPDGVSYTRIPFPSPQS